MIITTLQFSANLDEGVQETTLNQPLFTGDQEAHRFEILCFRNRRRESVSLTGADVQGYFVRSNQVTYPIKGEIINNSAVVQLPAACYSAAGPFSLVIKLALDGVIHTIFCGHGKMKAAHTDTIIDPGEVIPSLDELLAQIDAMEKATADALAVASMTAEAQTLPAGSLATAAYKDGKLTLGIPKGLDSETALPTGYKPNQMLVIDPDGKPCWEERTHYDYSGGGTVLPETTLNLLGGYTTFKEPFDPMPVVGVPYKVTYYGIEYTCTAQALEEDGRACVTIGNQSEIGAGVNTQEPFIFMFYPAETVTDGIYGYFSCTATDKSTMALSIVGAGEMKKLDPKFLPEGAGGGGLPTGGEPYKQLVTDGEGNAVWEDRLAYETLPVLTEILPETELAEEDGMFFALIPLSDTLKAGETYTVNWNGVAYECVGQEYAPAENVSFVVLGDLYIVSEGTAGTSTGEPFAVVDYTQMTGGEISIMAAPFDGSTAVTLSIGGKVKSVKQIAPRYLPEGIGYEADGDLVTFLEETTASTDENGNLETAGVLLRELITGRTYNVIYNGESYTVKARPSPIGEITVLTLGNQKVIGGSDTGEPFLLYSSGAVGSVLGFAYTDSSVPCESVAITGIELILHTIPEKFLPEKTGPMKLYLPQSTTVLNQNAQLSVYRDEDCTELCTTADYDELVAGRDFVVCVYNSSWYQYMICPPTAYAFLPNFSENTLIGIALTYAKGTSVDTQTVYLKFAD